MTRKDFRRWTEDPTLKGKRKDKEEEEEEQLDSPIRFICREVTSGSVSLFIPVEG